MTSALPTQAAEVQMVPISEIMRGEDVHTRQQLDQKTVARYVEAWDAGDEFPPIVLYFEDGTYWLADGAHRVESRVLAGFEDILAEVRPGGRREAILHALTCDRNLPRTNADKRKAATMLLQDPEWRQWSDQEIGRRCGVSGAFVGKLRRELGYADGERKGKDGRKTKVTKIGKGAKAHSKRFRVGKGSSESATDDTKPPTTNGHDGSTQPTSAPAQPTDPQTTNSTTTTPLATAGATDPDDPPKTTSTTQPESTDTTGGGTSTTAPEAPDDGSGNAETTDEGADQSSEEAAEGMTPAEFQVAFRAMRVFLRKYPKVAKQVIATFRSDLHRSTGGAA